MCILFVLRAKMVYLLPKLRERLSNKAPVHIVQSFNDHSNMHEIINSFHFNPILAFASFVSLRLFDPIGYSRLWFILTTSCSSYKYGVDVASTLKPTSRGRDADAKQFKMSVWCGVRGPSVLCRIWRGRYHLHSSAAAQYIRSFAGMNKQFEIRSNTACDCVGGFWCLQ